MTRAATYTPPQVIESKPRCCTPGHVTTVRVFANGSDDSFVEYTIENTLYDVYFVIPEVGQDSVRHYEQASGILRVPFSQERMRISGKTEFLFHLDWRCSEEFDVREFSAYIDKTPIVTTPIDALGVVQSAGVIPEAISDIPKTPIDVIADRFLLHPIGRWG